MQSPFIRIQRIVIKNFKNVGYGVINVSNYSKDKFYDGEGTIVGLYGQNGSGKTALVDAMSILKSMLQGKALPDDISNYIKYGEESTELSFDFYMDIEGKGDCNHIKFVNYEFELKRDKDMKVIVSKEKLSASVYKDGKWTKMTTIFDYDVTYDDPLFLPKYRYNNIINSNTDNYIQLKMAKEFSSNFNENTQQVEISSFLFSKRTLSVIENSEEKERDLSYITNHLSGFSKVFLIVIDNRHFGQIEINSSRMPFNISWNRGNDYWYGNFRLDITDKDENLLPKENFELVKKIIAQVNLVIKTIIPGLTMKIVNEVPTLMKDGQEGIRFQLAALRGNAVVPLIYESSGIKKIISILSNMIFLYNHNSACIVIDELDAGIYEFLLGELLELLQENAKGQLFFTSHNLRALEVLNNDSLVYTTTNINNRYTRIAYVKSHNNKRLQYLRTVLLGGQKEELYDETNNYEISAAFRKAGRLYSEQGKNK